MCGQFNRESRCAPQLKSAKGYSMGSDYTRGGDQEACAVRHRSQRRFEHGQISTQICTLSRSVNALICRDVSTDRCQHSRTE
jgi:hypothetical protein